MLSIRVTIHEFRLYLEFNPNAEPAISSIKSSILISVQKPVLPSIVTNLLLPDNLLTRAISNGLKNRAFPDR